MNQAKLKLLVEHLQEGGATDVETLANILGVTVKAKKTIERYLAACEEKDENLTGLTVGGSTYYNDEESEDEEEPTAEEDSVEEEEEPEETPAPEKPVKKKGYRFFLKNDDGTSTEIFQVSKSASVVTFTTQIEDIVKVMIKGEVVDVDIIPLRKLPPKDDSPYGMSNELLLQLALAAK